MKRGLFLVFEGPEGAGKTTQAELLTKVLTARGLNVVLTREPGGTTVGEQIRNALLSGDDVPDRTELLLYCASRGAFVERVVIPALKSGAIVISDRFNLSTMAYQIAARGLPEEESLRIDEFARAGLEPDINIVLAVTLATGRVRQQKQGKKPDRLERERDEFHRRVREGYSRFGRTLPNVHWVDTDGRTPKEVHGLIITELDRRFPDILNPR